MDEKKFKVIIHNLSNDTIITYMNISPYDALINAAIILDGKLMSLYNPMIRDYYRNKIISGDKTISIDDLVTIK